MFLMSPVVSESELEAGVAVRIVRCPGFVDSRHRDGLSFLVGLKFDNPAQ